MAGVQAPAVGFVADVYFYAEAADVTWDGDAAVVAQEALLGYADRLRQLLDYAGELGLTVDVDWSQAEVNCGRGTWDGCLEGGD